MSAAVLIVEDERLVAQDLKETLAQWGYAPITVASSCDEALRTAESSRPDIVLMDIRIKGSVDGIATAALLRQNWDLPIIYLTAHADQPHLDRAKPTEPYGYLLKPVKGPELKAAVEIGLHRHRSERRARQRDRWYFATLCAITEGVVTIDQQGGITFMNPGAESLTGWKLAEALGRPAEEILHLTSLTENAEDPLWQALQGQASEGWLGTLRCVTGVERCVSDSSAPVYDGDKLLGAVLVFRDLTLERELRQQLEMSQRLASLGTLAAGVAHEINNPLTVIASGANLTRQFLDATPLGPDELQEARETLSDISDASQRIQCIVADLRDFCQGDSAHRAGSDLVRAVQWAVRMTAQQFHEIPVECQLPDQTPVRLDETRCGQICLNLLMNAAQSLIPEIRPPWVKVQVQEDCASGQVTLVVEDSGRGIPPSYLARVFDPFFTTKDPRHGMGLGLSVVHGILVAAGGNIRIDSDVTRGTTVTVSLPAATNE